MAENRVYTYEAMFLVGQAAAADLKGTVEHVKEILGRGKAQIIAMRKWDERRLAYPVRGQKRGFYILCYFQAAGSSYKSIERDCNLSEKVLRTLILRCDHMTLEQMQAADGQRELELEAKLRAERPADVPVGAGVGDGSEPAAPAGGAADDAEA